MQKRTITIELEASETEATDEEQLQYMVDGMDEGLMEDLSMFETGYRFKSIKVT